MFARIATRTGVQLPSPPAFALRHEKRRLPRRSKTKTGVLVATVSALEGYGLAGQPCSFIMRATRWTQSREMLTHCEYKPWKIEMAVAFRSEAKVQCF